MNRSFFVRQMQPAHDYNYADWPDQPDFGKVESRPKKDGYTGQWYVGTNAKQGHGRQEYGDGLYEGSWLNRKREGMGRLVYRNGDVHFGLFKNDLKARGAHLCGQTADLYIGEWNKYYRSGHGILLYGQANARGLQDDPGAPELKYEGHWLNDMRRG